jgi:Arc/MetJ-type ribon-helix-helix transcriptional regulator
MTEMSGLSASEVIVMALRLLYETKQAELKKIKKAQDAFHAAKNFKNV